MNVDLLSDPTQEFKISNLFKTDGNFGCPIAILSDDDTETAILYVNVSPMYILFLSTVAVTVTKACAE